MAEKSWSRAFIVVLQDRAGSGPSAAQEGRAACCLPVVRGTLSLTVTVFRSVGTQWRQLGAHCRYCMLGLSTPCPQAAGQEDNALTPEVMNCSSIRLSSEFCCCRTADSAIRLALRVRMLLCKEGRELTWPQGQAGELPGGLWGLRHSCEAHLQGYGEVGNLLRHCWVSMVLCITLLVPNTDPVPASSTSSSLCAGTEGQHSHKSSPAYCPLSPWAQCLSVT